MTTFKHLVLFINQDLSILFDLYVWSLLDRTVTYVYIRIIMSNNHRTQHYDEEL